MEKFNKKSLVDLFFFTTFAVGFLYDDRRIQKKMTKGIKLLAILIKG